MHGCVFAHSLVIRKFYARALNSRMVELKMNENETKDGRQTMRLHRTWAYMSQEESSAGTETKWFLFSCEVTFSHPEHGLTVA